MKDRRFRQARPNQLTIDWDAKPEPEAISKPPDTLPDSKQGELKITKRPQPQRHRLAVVARLPVPRPLPAAVAAGQFGHDEGGKPIRPAADEVRAITINQADKLIDMLDALVSIPGRPATAEKLSEEFGALLAAYARDFGEPASRQLEAFARRQSSLEEELRTDHGWSR